MEKEKSTDTKEEFCGACAVIPLALAGAGVAGLGANKKGVHKKTKKILLWGGITVTLLSVIIALLYLRNCKSCQ